MRSRAPPHEGSRGRAQLLIDAGGREGQQAGRRAAGGKREREWERVEASCEMATLMWQRDCLLQQHWRATLHVGASLTTDEAGRFAPAPAAATYWWLRPVRAEVTRVAEVLSLYS